LVNVRATVSRMWSDDGSGGSAPDALTLIHGDHEEVSALFQEALADDVPAARRRALATRIVTALTIHAKMEETIFYPALRKAGKTEEKNSVLEATEEHGLMKDLIAKISRLEPRDETFMAKLTVLEEVVHHHVKEEEATIFNEARRVLSKRLEELGAEMQRFKERAANGKARKPSSGRRAPAPATGVKKKSAVTTRKKSSKR
jgi:hemerythrin superfamily protein